MKGSGFISRWDIDKNKYGVRNFAIDKLKRTMTDAQNVERTSLSERIRVQNLLRLSKRNREVIL